MPARLILVSNRLPIHVGRNGGRIVLKPSTGGLAAGLAAVHSRKPSLWVGWAGLSLDELSWSERRDVEELLASQNYYPVFLSRSDVEGFYHGFCNSTIWPLFHYFPEKTVYSEEFWEAYKRVNKLFAEAVLEVYRPGDTIWVHDYHLMLLPGMLREELGDDAAIGFFLHIPFPSYELFKLLPWRTELLRGLLGADLVGFHTYNYVDHFLRTVSHLLGLGNVLGRINYDGRIVLADAFPMGIDFEEFTRMLSRREVVEKTREYMEKFKGLHVIFSVDRLDYTKGIPERLRAYKLFLEKHPGYRGRVVWVLIVSPSRTGVHEYAELKREIDKLVGEINGEFGTLDWSPVIYIYRYVPDEDLLALYQVADIALITPLRDGMNLVSKEYVAAKTTGDGVLILSENAGAAEELVEALIVNPNSVSEIAEAIRQAIEMSREERVERMNALRSRVQRYNVHRWASDFLERLSRVKEEQKRVKARLLRGETLEGLVAGFCRAVSRLLLLDYDGTLVPIRETPAKAEPDPELLRLLTQLSTIPETEVVIISGRDRGTLAKWFKGLEVTLVAEHGAWIRRRGGEWRPVAPAATEWKKEIKRILEVYLDRAPGSHIEEKEFSIAWHYRGVVNELGEARARELRDILVSLLASYNLEVLEGNKVIEVRVAGLGKGRAASELVKERDWGFILAIGDDQTDEEMFASLPAKAYTIRVGFGPTNAKYSLEDYADVRDLLRRILEACGKNVGVKG